MVGRFRARRSNTAQDAAAAGRPNSREDPRLGRGRHADLCGGLRCRRKDGRSPAIGRPARRRPRRPDLLEPDGIHRDAAGLRLAWRRPGADQHRFARTAAAAYPVEFWRAASGRRRRLCGESFDAGCFGALGRSHLVDRCSGEDPDGEHRRRAHAQKRHWDLADAFAAERSCGHPLYFRDHRTIEGRLLSTRTVFLVGGEYRRGAGASAG